MAAWLRTLGHSAIVYAVAWSPDGGTLASASGNGSVRLWDVATGAVVRTLSTDRHSLASQAWSPNGQTIAAGSMRGPIHFWDASTGAYLRSLSDHSGSAALAWSPDGKTLAAGEIYGDGSIKLLEASSHRLLRVLSGHSKTLRYPLI